VSNEKDDPSTESDEPRERGVLTQGDRKYLRGEKSLEGSAEYNVQRRIRRRIRDSLLDFAFLADPELLETEQLLRAIRGETVETDDLIRSSEDPANDDRGAQVGPHAIVSQEPVIDPEIKQALLNVLVFSFRAIRGPSQYTVSVENAASEAFDRYMPEATITENDYRLEYEQPDEALRVARIKLDENRPLTDAEVRLLLERGDVGPDRVAEQVRAQASENDDTNDEE